MPLLYMCLRAFEPSDQGHIELARELVGPICNTALLTFCVLICVTLIAFPAAWLTTWTDLPGKRLFSLGAIMPLAIPGYVMAYALLGLGGYDGLVPKLTGHPISRLGGLAGSIIALSAYNLPYMFLNLRSALSDIDPSLEETARSLGDSKLSIFRNVILPQVTPAFLTGGLLVMLHVIADFGVVSLMRYNTLSRVLWIRFTTYDTAGAARIGLALLLMTAVILAVEMWFMRNLRLDRTGTGSRRRRRPIELRRFRIPAVGFFVLLFFVSVVAPTASIIHGVVQAELSAAWRDIARALLNSAQASAPAAVLATAIALPIAMMRARHPSRRSLIFERLPYLGYATPALAFALSLVFVSTRLADWTADTPFAFINGWTRQTLPLLVYAYVIHFIAEAIGPVRSSLYLATPRLEEASRALGIGPFATFFRVTLPVLRHGLIVSTALVFLSCMKELPLTMLLAPSSETLAVNVWTYMEDGAFAQAAPYALTILLFSAGFVGILLMQGRERT